MKKTKWTIIDTLIILAVVVVCFVGYKMFGSKITTPVQSDKAEIVVMVSNKSKGFSESIRIGENANLSLTEKNGGIVTKVNKKPASTITFNSMSGIYQTVLNEEKEDVYIYVDAQCDISDKHIKIGDTIVRVGESVAIRGKGYASEGFVIQINEGGDK